MEIPPGKYYPLHAEIGTSPGEHASPPSSAKDFEVQLIEHCII
jgi:hypothetical protein